MNSLGLQGQCNKEATLRVFTCVIYMCKVQLVNYLIKEFSTLELTHVA